jgi:hypothetical protein
VRFVGSFSQLTFFFKFECVKFHSETKWCRNATVSALFVKCMVSVDCTSHGRSSLFVERYGAAFRDKIVCIGVFGFPSFPDCWVMQLN